VSLVSLSRKRLVPGIVLTTPLAPSQYTTFFTLQQWISRWHGSTWLLALLYADGVVIAFPSSCFGSGAPASGSI
jgi:hypothetical protein